MSKEVIISLLIIFALKLGDNTFSTLKTLYLAKEKYLIAGLTNAIGTFFYLFAVVRVVQESNTLGIVVMCVATFLGTYIPGKVLRRVEGDKTFVFEITSNTLAAGKAFTEAMIAAGLPVKSCKVKDKHSVDVLEIKVFCQSKEDSRLVKNALPAEFKWSIYVPITR